MSIQDWAVGFFGLEELIGIIRSGDYSSLKTLKGIMAVIGPLFPIFVVIEFLTACLYRKLKMIDYKISFFSYLLNLTIGRFISIAMVRIVSVILSPHAIFKTQFNLVLVYLWIYRLGIWSFYLSFSRSQSPAALVPAQYTPCAGKYEPRCFLCAFFSRSALCRYHPDKYLYSAGC